MEKKNVGFVVVCSMIISFIGGALFVFFTSVSYDNGVITYNNSTIPIKEEFSINDSVMKVYDSVAVIEGFKNNNLASSGTGFIYKQNDNMTFLITNHHVISEMDSISILLDDGSKLDAKVVGSDMYSDIAVLSVKGKVGKIVSIGSNDKLKVGDTVFSVGSPQGADFAGTVTKGVLSGKDRLIAVALSGGSVSDYYMKVMQTDTAINPGNSGGPLCNINGEVIGVTNMKLVDGTIEGMGFAIPIEDAINYASILETGVNIERPYIGVGMVELNDSMSLWQSGISIPNNISEGIVVSQVVENSPANKVGLKKGDIILSIAGVKVRSIAEFRYELYKHKVGEEVTIELFRKNNVKKVKILLENNNK